jgi:hypothetical protein
MRFALSQRGGDCMVQKKENGKKEILTSAVIGTAVGAGLGAAAVALSDKKTRKNLVKKSSAVTEKAKKTVVSLPNQVRKTVSEGRKAIVKASTSRKSSTDKKKQAAASKKTTSSTQAKRTTEKARK